jgi:hypothetical protein
MISSAVDPAGQFDLLANMLGSKLAAILCFEHIASNK